MVKVAIEGAYASYLSDVQRCVKENPASLWSFINQKRGSTRIPGIMRSGDAEIDAPREIVNAFAELFSGRDNPTAIPSNAELSGSLYSSFNLSPVTETEVVAAMAALPNKISAGDDGIPCFVVRDCRFALARPITNIINRAIESSSFPAQWKIARVTPVFKKGDRSNLYNYRSTSI